MNGLRRKSRLAFQKFDRVPDGQPGDCCNGPAGWNRGHQHGAGRVAAFQALLNHEATQGMPNEKRRCGKR
ncbi:MAG: hypothetical protein WAN86_06635, partial [Hyphomicrobiaceae bacterium]